MLLPVLLLPIVLIGFSCWHRTADTRHFQKIISDYFSASLAGDSLSQHYTLADPSPYLSPISPASLPVYSRENQEQAAARVNQVLTSLQEIDPERLDSQNRFLHHLLTSYLETERTGNLCLYFEDPLSPTSGIHTELLILLAEYTFRSTDDVEDYLDLLESIPDYLDGLILYEQEKSAVGLFMPEADALEVMEQCDELMAPERLDAGTHFLQTTFSERLDTLLTELSASAADSVSLSRLFSSDPQFDPQTWKASLLSENDRLLKTVVAPAYVSLADQIFLPADSGSHTDSICQQKGGTAYYLYLLQKNTGSSRTPEEIRGMLTDHLQETHEELQSLLLRYQRLTGNLPAGRLTVVDFPLKNAGDILVDLQERMKGDFPAFPSAQRITCTVKPVDPAMEDYTSPAFYLTPPVDDVTHNTIYINQSQTLPGLELYTTLAHEGYPGHLYQTVYCQLQPSRTAVPLRSILNYNGYVEGWAYYTENLAYGYAADLLRETGSSEADCLLPLIAAAERNLQINLYCLMDLAIHYSGSSEQEIIDTLASFGMRDAETASDIYHYIRREPTTYLKYYLGYLEVLALRRKAEDLWQKEYSPLRFHTFLLEVGPADFDTLREALEGA